MSDLTLCLIFSIAWIATVIFFMYTTLKFVTTEFNIHPAWILFMVPVNLVWLVISMILADGVWFVLEKIFHFKFL